VNNIFYENPNPDNPEMLYAEPISPLETQKAIYDLSYEKPQPMEALYTLANSSRIDFVEPIDYALATKSLEENDYSLAD
jgi:hypothetical protein